MFPELKRIKQKISDEECFELLDRETRCVLSVIGENGYPYALPLNHYFDKSENAVYFHCGKVGYKLDCVLKNPKACLTVTEKGVRFPGEWWLTARSVIAFGKVRIVKEKSEVERVSRKLSAKFTSDASYVDSEIEKYLSATYLLKFEIEHMTGKRVKEN